MNDRVEAWAVPTLKHIGLEEGKMDLTNKVILIIGGAAGIGCATAELCAQRGARVVVADLDAAAGQATAERIGGLFVPVNVTSEDSVQAMFREIAARCGRLDGIVQSAGILQGAFVPLDEFSLETFQRVLDVNTTGSFLCAKHGAPLLRQAGGGVIVLVSSGAALGGSSSFAYGTSKGGVNTLGLLLANALAKDNIRVNVVMPGNIDTAMKRSVIEADLQLRGEAKNLQAAVQEARLGEPEGVARVLAWLVSDEADYVKGMITTR